MKIIFCETCHLRISAEDIDAGVVKEVAENQYLCAKCSAAAPAESALLANQETVVIAARPRSPSTRRANRPVSTVAAISDTAAHGPTSAREAARPRTTAEAQASNKTMVYVIVAVTIGMFAGLFAVIGSRGSPKKVAESNASPRAEAPDVPSKPKPSPAVTERSPIPVSPVVSKPAPEVKPPEPATPTKPPETSAPQKAPEPQPVPAAETPVKNDTSKSEPAPAPEQKPVSMAELEEAARKAANTKAKDTEEDDSAPAKKTPSKEPEPSIVKPAEPPPPPPQPAAPKAKPPFVKGQISDLFDRPSVVAKYAQGQRAIYENWTWYSQDPVGFSVKDNTLSIDKAGAFILETFPAKEFGVTMEIDLGADSALGIMLGENTGAVNLLIVTPTHVFPGAWEMNKAKDNISNNPKAAKPLGVKAQWISLGLAVHPADVDVFCGQKMIGKIALNKPMIITKFGFMTLSTKGQPNSSAKLRKVMMKVP